MPRHMAKKGDCYRLALLHAAGLDSEGEPGVMLCHGWAVSKGKRIGHAWVELQGGAWVVECTHENRVFPGDAYRERFEVSGVVRYTPEDARALAVRSGHFGPWDSSFDGVP